MGDMIYKAIASAMEEISPIAKAKKNKEQGFQYRGIDDVMNELNPIFAKHRIFVYPEVIKSERLERQTQKGGTLLYSILTVKYHFTAEDGSEVCTTVIGEGMDSGDKASNKAMAVAFKYACLQMFCIPTEDMPDPDNTTPPPTRPKQQQQSPDEKAEHKNLIDEIGEIVKTINPDSVPYFSDQEKEGLRNVVRNAKYNSILNEQLLNLKFELKKREEAFMKNDKNNKANDGFIDDIPWDKTRNPESDAELAIF